MSEPTNEDLAARLRELIREDRSSTHSAACWQWHPNCALGLAARRLTELSAECEALRRQRDAEAQATIVAHDKAVRLEAENAELRAQIAAPRGESGMTYPALSFDELIAEWDRLQAAGIAAEWDCWDDDDGLAALPDKWLRRPPSSGHRGWKHYSIRPIPLRLAVSNEDWEAASSILGEMEREIRP